MRANLELLARLLINVRAAQDGVLVLHRRQRNRSRDACPRALGRVNDLSRRLVKHAVIVSLQADANLFVQHNSLFNRRPCCFLQTAKTLSNCLLTSSGRALGRRLAYSRISETVPAPTVRPPSR